jgi:myo-inositol catabolism protein IolS
MQMRTLGSSDLAVSEIGIGGWAIGGPDTNLNMDMGWGDTDDDQSLKGLLKAFELGANHFDTADIYGHGHSERLIGQFLKQVPRHTIVIGTKVGYFRGCAPNAYHPLHIRHQLEMSLSNLGTDYIDIYYFHNFHFGVHDEYLLPAIGMMKRLKEDGKIRYIGLRGPHEYAPERAGKTKNADEKYERFLTTAQLVQPTVIQTRYNMISPTFDQSGTDIFQWAEQHHVGIVINKPLGQGLLLDKYDPEHPPLFQAGDHRRNKRWFQSEGLRALNRRLALLKERFGPTTQDLVRVALQYGLARSPRAVTIPGFKNAGQVAMNLAAAGHPLSKDDIQFIRTTMAGLNEEIGRFF